MLHNYVYLIMAPSGWFEPNIYFRRHRVAQFFKKQEDTSMVIWAYPVSASLRVPESLKRAKKHIANNNLIQANNSEIIEFALPDYMPARIMQYKHGLGNQVFNKLTKLVNNYQAKKVLWFAYPGYPFLANLLNWDLVVYDCSDLWTEPSGGARSNSFSSKFAKGLIDTAEKKIIEHSDLIFTSSDYLTEKIHRENSREAITVENGVDYYLNQREEGIEKDNPLKHIPKPRFGYIGAMRSKIDFELLDQLAKNNPEWSLVLTGPDMLNKKDPFYKLLHNDNVWWTGEAAKEDLPLYIRSLDVGLLPYRELEYNKAVFPIKFFEYLSQGIPIVGCGVPSTKKYSFEGIYLHVKREEFLGACKTVLSWTDIKDEHYYSERIKLARKSDWEIKLNYIHNAIKRCINDFDRANLK